MEESICYTCRFRCKDSYRCNRLVSTCVGRSDRLGSDYKKGNSCPYYKQGNQTADDNSNINFWNS